MYLLILPALVWSGRNLGCHPCYTHSLTGLYFVTVLPRSHRRFPWAVPLGLGTQTASAMSLAPPVHALLTLQTPSPPFPSCHATCTLPCSLSPLLSQKPPWHSPTRTHIIVDSGYSMIMSKLEPWMDPPNRIPNASSRCTHQALPSRCPSRANHMRTG